MRFKMLPRIIVIVLLPTMLALSGCGPRHVAGGTSGFLRAKGSPLSEIQLTVNEVDGNGWHAIGFGVSDTDGKFELVTNGAHGPLRLPSGKYRFTLESVGAPLQIPQEYTKAETTPLDIDWTKGGVLTLDLDKMPEDIGPRR